MLSRIARGLYLMARDVERAANVARMLEVHHRMNLTALSEQPELWQPVLEACELPAAPGGERHVYESLMLSRSADFSVAACIARAREEGRTKRQHLSEEMWLHLNRYYLDLQDLSIDELLGRGRSEFHLEIETFCDAFFGIADSTMVRGPEWHFLQLGKHVARADMLCRTAGLQLGSLDVLPGEEGGPVDYHFWQALLRSVSGYEPYRRTHDVRIVPARVVDFLLRNEDFPRSLLHCLCRVQESLAELEARDAARDQLRRRVATLVADIARVDADEVLREGGLGQKLAALLKRCASLDQAIEETYFRSMILARHPGTGRFQIQAAQQ